MSKPFRVLLLAGTGEARQLAGQLADIDNLKVIASLAGATSDPIHYPVETRTGGFGGAAGLARYLNEKGVDLIVNASHPFASVMSANAAHAGKATGTPLLRLLRKPWQPAEGDRWLDVAGMADAIAAVPDGARVFFATGRGSVDQIAAVGSRNGVWGAIRLIDPPDQCFPLKHGEFIQARPPFRVEEELALMQRLNISHLVTKNAGGASGMAKLEAARKLGIKVIAINRPRQPDGQTTVATQQEVMALVFDLMSQSGPDKA